MRLKIKLDKLTSAQLSKQTARQEAHKKKYPPAEVHMKNARRRHRVNNTLVSDENGVNVRYRIKSYTPLKAWLKVNKHLFQSANNSRKLQSLLER